MRTDASLMRCSDGPCGNRFFVSREALQPSSDADEQLYKSCISRCSCMFCSSLILLVCVFQSSRATLVQVSDHCVLWHCESSELRNQTRQWIACGSDATLTLRAIANLLWIPSLSHVSAWKACVTVRCLAACSGHGRAASSPTSRRTPGRRPRGGRPPLQEVPLASSLREPI